MYQKTLVLLKPDAVQRHLCGRIIDCFEECGLKIHGLKMMKVQSELAQEHYGEHRGKDFFEKMCGFICSSPIVAMVIGGGGAITKVRQIVGSTEPAQALPSTIRGRYAHQPFDNAEDGIIKNLIHASDSPESAEREIALWFASDEVLEYGQADDFFVGI